MVKNNVLELISQGEGPKLEFKRDDVRPEDLGKVIVGFANMNGGVILLGVGDDGSICGTSRANPQEWVVDTVIGRYVTPYIHPDYEEIKIEQHTVAVISIPAGAAKPYMLKSNDRQDVYVRYGNTSRLADREQQMRLFESGGHISVEKLLIRGANPDELSRFRYRQYFSQITRIFGNEETEKIDDAFLTQRGFLVSENDTLFCSRFAYALFGKRPGLRLPQAPVRVTVFPGTDKDYNTLLDETLDTPYVELRDEDASIVEPAIQEKVLFILQPHISQEQLVGMTRKRMWYYPPEAIREAVVNALIHRDWTKPDYVRVVLYSDRLEIESPGALPNGMTVEKIKTGKRLARNQEFVRIFRDYGYLEDLGMGVRRKIIPLSAKYSDREPNFEAAEDHFTITLYKAQSPRVDDIYRAVAT